jgi:hypothetical protein
MNLFSRILLYSVRILILGLVFIKPASAQMALISEARSVTVSYYGSGVETHSSNGMFGMFDASAVGIPFGGGSVSVSQHSNITSSEITLDHRALDMFGPGGFGRSNFEVKFSLPEDTRITVSGDYWWYKFASLSSESLGPLAWDTSPYYNEYRFDRVLGPGVYTFSSTLYAWEYQRETIVLRATSAAPDSGSAFTLLAGAVIGLLAIHRRRHTDAG